MNSRVPLRNAQGQIVDVADPDAVPADAAPESATEPGGARANSARSGRPIAPDAQRSMADVLGHRTDDPAPVEVNWPIVIVSIVLIIAGAVVFVLMNQQTLATLAVAPPTPIPLVSPSPTVAPATVTATSVPAPYRLPRAVVAYAAPDGSVVGALEPQRSFAIHARSGAEWLQVAVADAGLVWVRQADVASADIAAAVAALPDMATATPAPTSTIVAQPSATPAPRIGNWCTPELVVGRARSGALIVESCQSQADAERTLDRLLRATEQARP
jgi:hypothetical protein